MDNNKMYYYVSSSFSKKKRLTFKHCYNIFKINKFLDFLINKIVECFHPLYLLTMWRRIQLITRRIQTINT